MNQHLRPEPVTLHRLAAQRRRLGKSVDEAVFPRAHPLPVINGPEVAQLEAELGGLLRRQARRNLRKRHRRAFDVLMAKGVGRGDAVLCPSFTFCATGEAVALTRRDAGVRRTSDVKRHSTWTWLR